MTCMARCTIVHTGSADQPLPSNAVDGRPAHTAGQGTANSQEPLQHREGGAALQGSNMELYDPHRTFWQRAVSEWLLPVLVVAVGVACSVAGLYVSVRDLGRGL